MRIGLFLALMSTMLWATTASENFGGLGITIQSAPQGVLVVDVVPGSPAELNGIQKGDIITQVDALNLQGSSIEVAKNALRGQVGSSSEIFIQRTSGTLQVEVTRISIKVQSLPAEQINQFYGDVSGSSVKVEEALYYAQNEVGENYEVKSILVNGLGVEAVSEQNLAPNADIKAISIGKIHDFPSLENRLPQQISLLSLTRQQFVLQIQSASPLTLRLMDSQGREVHFQKVANPTTGVSPVAWSGEKLPTGNYTLQVQQGSYLSSYQTSLH